MPGYHATAAVMAAYVEDEEDPFANFGMEEWLQEEECPIETEQIIVGDHGLCDTEVDQFIQDSRAANTVKKTKSDLKVWYRWCEA